MAKNSGRSPSGAIPKTQPNGWIVSRSGANGRFLSVASLEPVSKRGIITSAQADKAVKQYLASHPK
jgi:hypothetical protein